MPADMIIVIQSWGKVCYILFCSITPTNFGQFSKHGSVFKFAGSDNFNTPLMINLTKFWLRYLRSKTHETIFKHDCLLQGQAQLDQRAVFCFCTLRFFSPSPSSFPSCWYWCYWWWTKPFLEQNVQMSVIFIPIKSIIINIIEWYHVSLTSNKIACFKVKLRWTRGSFFVLSP